jgi:hypothetical protein
LDLISDRMAESVISEKLVVTRFQASITLMIRIEAVDPMFYASDMSNIASK